MSLFRLNRLLMNLTVGLSWNSYIILLNILSLNRCVMFNCNKQWNERLFGQKATTVCYSKTLRYFRNIMLFKKWIMFCWFCSLCWLGFNLSPLSGYMYYPKLFLYYFDFNVSMYEEGKFANLLSCIVHISFIWIWCVFAVVGFKKQVTHFDTILIRTQFATISQERPVLFFRTTNYLVAKPVRQFVTKSDAFWYSQWWFVQCSAMLGSGSISF